MNSSKLSLAALSLAALVSFSANAEDNSYYLQLNGGMARGLAPKGDIGGVKMGSSGLVGVEAGYQFNQNLRASLSLDYLTNFSWTEYCPAGGLDELEQNQKYKNKSFVGMVNIYYDIIEAKGFTPYITLGAGVASNKTNIYLTENTGSLEENSAGSNKKTNFAYKLGLGAKYNLSQNMALDLRYQFMNLGKIQTGPIIGAVDSAGDRSEALSKTGKARAHEFLVGFIYKF